MNDDFIAWLCILARCHICYEQKDCIDCPFYDDKVDDCSEMTADQKREILMKIYESEVNTDASNN